MLKKAILGKDLPRTLQIETSGELESLKRRGELSKSVTGQIEVTFAGSRSCLQQHINEFWSRLHMYLEQLWENVLGLEQV